MSYFVKNTPKLLRHSMLTNPTLLTQKLIQHQSITPAEAGSLAAIENWLAELGFTCERFDKEETANLYASMAPGKPAKLCYVGHVDVVPAGDKSAWTYSPFEGKIADDILYGRGAVDMKGSIGAFIASLAKAKASGKDLTGVAIALTSDEEGAGTHGIPVLVEALKSQNHLPQHVLVGEPSSSKTVGDTIRVGRRGSLNGILTVTGIQGHVAYPENCENPIPPLMTGLQLLNNAHTDDMHPAFPLTRFEVVGIESSSQVSNLVPQWAKGLFSLRFTPTFSGQDHIERLNNLLGPMTSGFPECQFRLETKITAQPFYTKPGPYRALIKEAVKEAGCDATEDTGGGTSDGRHFAPYCDVVEVGLCNATAHAIDEHVSIADLEKLTELYEKILLKL